MGERDERFALAMAQHENLRADTYRMHELKPRTGDAVLVELLRRGALTSAQLSRAVTDWPITMSSSRTSYAPEPGTNNAWWSAYRIHSNTLLPGGTAPIA